LGPWRDHAANEQTEIGCRRKGAAEPPGASLFNRHIAGEGFVIPSTWADHLALEHIGSAVYMHVADIGTKSGELVSASSPAALKA
jgi:hypothetical protein